jgi:fatty-acyl-CoA synthase
MGAFTESYWPRDESRPVDEATVGGILQAAADARPTQIAIIEGCADPTARRQWTYGQLRDDAERAARALCERFEPEERIAVWAPNIPEWIILEFGVALAGLTLVTVNPAYRPSELSYVLNQSGAAGIFLVPEFRTPMAEFLEQVRPDVPDLREVILFTEWDAFLGGAPTTVPLPRVEPTDIAQIQYTSGTTGFPQGREAAPSGPDEQRTVLHRPHRPPRR